MTCKLSNLVQPLTCKQRHKLRPTIIWYGGRRQLGHLRDKFLLTPAVVKGPVNQAALPKRFGLGDSTQLESRTPIKVPGLNILVEKTRGDRRLGF